MNTSCIIGASGTGKSTLLRQRISDDPQYALLTSSTGISAVNLGEGVTTIHSALGFFDLRSLCEAHKYGRIKKKFLELAQRGKKNLVLDEVSMFSGDALQLVHDGAHEAAMIREDKGLASCGLVLTGDMCQLSPVPDEPKQPVKYAFEAPCWELYEQNMEHLTDIKRQTNPQFQLAMNLARAGRGVDAAFELRKCGVEFVPYEDDSFDGITLFAVNAQVQSYNERRLAALPGEVVTIPSERWGKERSEWKQIPEKLELKDGALVMVLVNQPGTFEYVNGDLANFIVKKAPTDVDPGSFADYISFEVETKRGYKGVIPMTIRRNLSWAAEHSRENEYKATTYGRQLKTIEDNEGRSSKRWYAVYMSYLDSVIMRGECYYDPREQGTVIGEVKYMPLRVAYASTTHKTQGLTVDKAQIVINHHWFSSPGMAYVALSRVRSAEGLRIVGDLKSLAKRIVTDARVKRWV